MIFIKYHSFCADDEKTVKNRAFSLIEMLLVILIFGALVSGGLYFAAQYVQEVKVEKTAAQLNQILEAGAAYRADKNFWPETADDFAPYLKIDDLKNPWGGNYNYGGNNIKFWVSTTLPNSLLVSRVVNLLFNAYGDGNKVSAEIAMQLIKPRFFINTIGSLSFTANDLDDNGHGSKPVQLPRCPLSTVQKIIVTPRNIEFGTLWRTWNVAFPYNIGTAAPISCARQSDDICEANIAVDFNALGCLHFDTTSDYECTQGTGLVKLTGPMFGIGQSSGATYTVMQDDGAFEVYYISYCEPLY